MSAREKEIVVFYFLSKISQQGQSGVENGALKAEQQQKRTSQGKSTVNATLKR